MNDTAPDASPMSGTKQCTKCGVIKPMTEFHREPKGRNGRRSQCKDCENRGKRLLRQRYQARRWINPPTGQKRCSRCGLEKPVSAYHVDRCKKIGIRNNCNVCTLDQPPLIGPV